MNPGQAEAAKSALGGSDKPKAKKFTTREVTIRKGHAGGYIARHRMEDEEGNASARDREYPLSSMKDVHEHLSRHLPESQEEKAEMEKGSC